MSIFFYLASFQKIWSQAQAYFSQHVLSWAMAAQIVVIVCALLLAYKISGAMRAWFAASRRNTPQIRNWCRPGHTPGFRQGY